FLGFRKSLVSGRNRFLCSQISHCWTDPKLIEDRPELIHQLVINNPMHQVVQMHEPESPVVVMFLFCKPPFYGRFYVRICVPIADQDPFTLIYFNSNMKRG